MKGRLTWFNVTSIAIGFAFLYIPILLLVIYSFNDSKLVTVWGGWSTKWYANLFNNEELMRAAWVTLRVSFLDAAIGPVSSRLWNCEERRRAHAVYRRYRHGGQKT